jgi:hypothetical protein
LGEELEQQGQAHYLELVVVQVVVQVETQDQQLFQVVLELQVKVLLEARVLVVAVVAVQGRLVEPTDPKKAAMVFGQTLLGQTLNERGVVVLVEAQLGPQEAQVAVVLVLEILLELRVREINLKEEEAAVDVQVPLLEQEAQVSFTFVSQTGLPHSSLVV